MTGATGYYCLIQYCPDPARLEAANVGVVLLCADKRFFKAKLSRRNDRVTHFFSRDEYDIDRINVLKKGLVRRIEEVEEVDSRESLERFASLQCNLLRVTAPLGCRVESDPAATLNELFGKLVGEPVHKEKIHGVKRKLRDSFASHDLLGTIIREDVPVRIPAFERTREFPFAWQNGHTNLIEPIRFKGADPKTVESNASRLAMEGRSLQEAGDDQLGECRLHVIAEFDTLAEPAKSVVRNIFKPFAISLHETSQLPSYIQKVKSEGHEFTPEA